MRILYDMEDEKAYRAAAYLKNYCIHSPRCALCPFNGNGGSGCKLYSDVPERWILDGAKEIIEKGEVDYGETKMET